MKDLTVQSLIQDARQHARPMLSKFWAYFILMSACIGGAMLISTYSDIYLFEPHLSYDPLEFYFVSRASEMFVELLSAPFIAALFTLAIAAMAKKPLKSVALSRFFHWRVWKELFGYRIMTLLFTHMSGLCLGVVFCVLENGINKQFVPYLIEFVESSNTMNFISIGVEFMFILASPLIVEQQLEFPVAMQRSAQIIWKNFIPALSSITLCSLTLIVSLIPLTIDVLNQKGVITWFSSLAFDLGLKILGGGVFAFAFVWLMPMMFLILARVYLNALD